MMTIPISTLHHPALIDQTDRDPHRDRDEDAERRRQQARHPHLPHPPAPADEPPASDEHRTIGLLLDVKA